jgi:hypothetical protein
MGKIKFTLIILLGISACVTAQDLYVSPSSYLFVQDEVLFVTNDIRLDDADSNIFLRDDAQLIQDVDTKNSDLGSISVYQKQTTGIYEYNYWSSPVGVPSNGLTKENKDFNITNLYKPDAPAVSSNISSSVYGITNSYNSTASEIAKYWLWKLVSGTGYADWVQVSNVLDVPTGLGFTMKGSPTVNNTIDFRGRANTGTFTNECLFVTDTDPTSGSTNQVETLSGNPYPSSMDLWKFLTIPLNKTSLDGSIYFWEQKNIGSHNLQDYEGGYAVWTVLDDTDDTDQGSYAQATFTNYDANGGNTGATGNFSDNYGGTFSRRFAAIGQGFMVRSDVVTQGGNFEINNSTRIYLKQSSSKNDNNSAHFGRSSSPEANGENNYTPMSHNGLDYQNIMNNPKEVSEIRIHTKINDSYYRENVLNFISSKSLSFNKFGDAIHPFVLKGDTYFIADNNKLVIKSIAYDIDAKLPFGLNADNTVNTFSVKINSTKNVSENIEFFVHDKEQDTYTDIKNGVFELTLPQGEYDNRFEIVFKDASNVLSEEIVELEDQVINSFDIFQNNTSNQFIIKNPQSHIIKSFIMYDVTGKVIFNKQNLGNELEYSFPTNNLSSGTYVTKITTDQNFEITKKVIVNN